MQQIITIPKTLKDQITNQLRRSPGLRGTLYLTTAAVTLEGMYFLQDKSLPYNAIRLHMKTAPVVGLLTCVGLYLQPDHVNKVDLSTIKKALIQTLQGATLGIGAYLSWASIAAACGWVALPLWGWETTPVDTVLQSAALFGLGHLAIAWNEEQVFRGYGFDTLCEVVGGWGAVAILTPLFALGHGLSSNAFQILDFVVVGGVFTLMRVATGSIWFGVGYHWMWNFMQTGIFGPVAAEPSLRPMLVNGPYQWVGKPGFPEPGMLSTLIQCTVGIGLGILWFAKKRRKARG